MKSILNSYLNTLVMFFLTFLVEHNFEFNFTLNEWLIALVLPFAPVLLKVIQGSKWEWLNTPMGTLVKYGVTAAIGFIINKGTFVGWAAKELFKAVIMAVLPLMTNAVNPLYKHYGVQAKEA